MKNDFEKLMEQAAKHLYKRTCSIGDWCFEPSGTGNFVVSYKGEAVVSSKNNQIIDAKWGSRIAGVEVCDILSSLLKNVPHIQLDAMVVRTDDCLASLGYDGPSYPISDIPGLEDIDYYRAWVTSKENSTDPKMTDYVVYWDQGNTWCEVLAVFEGVTHEQFVEGLHNKYREWIREEEQTNQEVSFENISPSASLDALIKQAFDYTTGACVPLDMKAKDHMPEI